MSEENPEGLDRKKAKALFRSTLTDNVANGWHIEIENDYDAVLSKKRSFNWIPHILIILFGLFVFVPLAVFWIFVMIILAVTQKSKTKRIWVDPEGEVHSR